MSWYKQAQDFKMKDSNQSNVEEFFKQLNNLTTVNPIDPSEVIIGNAGFQLRRGEGNVVWMSSMRRLDPNGDSAQGPLKWVIELADEVGVEIQGTPKPFDSHPNNPKLSKQDLIGYYGKHGFEYDKGRNIVSRKPANKL